MNPSLSLSLSLCLSFISIYIICIVTLVTFADYFLYLCFFRPRLALVDPSLSLSQLRLFQRPRPNARSPSGARPRVVQVVRSSPVGQGHHAWKQVSLGKLIWKSHFFWLGHVGTEKHDFIRQTGWAIVGLKVLIDDLSGLVGKIFLGRR